MSGPNCAVFTQAKKLTFARARRLRSTVGSRAGSGAAATTDSSSCTVGAGIRSGTSTRSPCTSPEKFFFTRRTCTSVPADSPFRETSSRHPGFEAPRASFRCGKKGSSTPLNPPRTGDRISERANLLSKNVALGLALRFQRLVFTSEARPFAIHTSPHRQHSTFRTVPRKPSMDLANVILKLATRYLRPLAARTAFQRQGHWPRIRHLRRRKFRLPE